MVRHFRWFLASGHQGAEFKLRGAEDSRDPRSKTGRVPLKLKTSLDS